MKHILISLLATLLISISQANGQSSTIIVSGTTPTSITVAAHQVLKVLSFNHGGAEGYIQLVREGVSMPLLRSIDQNQFFANGFQKQGTNTPVVVGPATIHVTGTAEGSRLAFSYSLTDNAAAASASLPSPAVVIPADASGEVQIILESSTDLITWTAALPGSYSSSTTKRFFRIRAITQP